MVIDGVTGYLIPPDDSTTLASTLGHITRDEAKKLADGVRGFKSRWDWASLERELGHLASMIRTST